MSAATPCSGSGTTAGNKAHLVEIYDIATDPAFEDKDTDVVGVYPKPLGQAMVLYLHEKSKVQAWDRTQPSLPMRPGRARHAAPRLQVERHHHAVRRAERAHRIGELEVPDPAPARGISEIPPHRRQGGDRNTVRWI